MAHPPKARSKDKDYFRISASPITNTELIYLIYKELQIHMTNSKSWFQIKWAKELSMYFTPKEIQKTHETMLPSHHLK